ncbi:hypothetical protein ACFU7Y_24285 [Kitasatospora sp. NPDC057542]|uniref:hypothetical protein n=1 Tax=Streptomycetaceae TaxID=2062 RepID=UPI001CCA2E84|nr:hypothetical protein [Streptomyces sp. LS1784]
MHFEPEGVGEQLEPERARPRRRPAVLLGLLTISHHPEQETGPDGYGLVFDYLRSSALNPAQSIDMITAIAAGT